MNNERIIECIKKVHKGDKKAFAEMYDDLKTPIFTIIYRLTRNKEHSEDILHDLFVKLYQSPPALSVNNPRAYIFQMARNLTLNSMRTLPMEGLNEDCISTDDSFSDSIAWQIDISEAMKKLPYDEVEIVSFHVYGEMKFREISEMLQMPLGTVLWKYRTAVKKLRTYLNGGKL